MSKRAGLIIWPAIGALLFVVPGGDHQEQPGGRLGAGVRDMLGPAVLFVVLGFQVGALVLAGRGPGAAATAGDAGTKADRETTARSD